MVPLRLRERRPRLCRLAADEVRYLLEHHRAHVELTPTADRRIWRVTPGGVVGVVLTPRRPVVIDSKIPLSNLLFTFGAAERAESRPSGDTLDALGEHLALRMLERAACGLHRGYRERPHQGAYLVGRLDVAEQMRRPPARRDQLHGVLDDFTADVPCNLVPKALAARLARSPCLGEAARQMLRRAVLAFDVVSDIELSTDELAREPVPAGYGPLVDLCLVLTSALGASHRGPTSLLISLERWFERYVAAVVGPEALSQRTFHVGEPGVTVRPDVILGGVVIDAKWKRLAGGPERADLYQALAYAALLGSSDAVLVYPGRGKRQTITFERVPTRVHVCRLSVTGPPDRFLGDLRAIRSASP